MSSPSTFARAPSPPAATATLRRRGAAAFLLLPEVRWAALAVLLFTLGGISQLAGAPTAVWWTFYLLCYAAGGWEPGLAGLRALRHKTLDVDLLMVLAAIAAAAIGQVLEGALLIVIFATSGALEAALTKRTRDSVNALLDLAPQEANRLAVDGTETAVPAAELEIDDLIRIRPGELVAADGVVVEGRTDVDQASITGESVPVVKVDGADVFAGTLNGTGALVVRVTRRAEDSVVARIVAMVAEASETKAETQLFIENIEQKYSIGIVVATLALLVVPLTMGAALQPTLLRAITFMIVASPCAVVLATMPPLLSAIANAGRHGVLVKSAVVMEKLGVTDTIAFDKTGTLTVGAPHVVGVDLAPGATMNEHDLLRTAAAAEVPSQHPLAAAIVAAATTHPDKNSAPLPAARDFESIPGRGVSAWVGEHNVAVMSPDLRLDHIAGAAADALRGHTNRAAAGAVVPPAGLEQLIRSRQNDGSTVVLVAVDGRIQGLISLADQLRQDAVAAVQTLATVTTYPLVLLTGDNRAAADRLAAEVNIGDVRAELLPEDKVSAVRQLEDDGHKVVLVGDGVNDAPAMAAAHLGIAMGRHGSDLALETADAVIVRDELTAVAKVIDLSRRARRVVVANLIIAFTIIVVFVVWDLVGHLPLPLGVAAHEGSTIIVGLNGLRLLRAAAWRRAAATPSTTPPAAPADTTALAGSAK